MSTPKSDVEDRAQEHEHDADEQQQHRRHDDEVDEQLDDARVAEALPVAAGHGWEPIGRLRRRARPHHVERRGHAEPELEGERALAREHAEAVRARAGRGARRRGGRASRAGRRRRRAPTASAGSASQATTSATRSPGSAPFMPGAGRLHDDEACAPRLSGEGATVASRRGRGRASARAPSLRRRAPSSAARAAPPRAEHERADRAPRPRRRARARLPARRASAGTSVLCATMRPSLARDERVGGTGAGGARVTSSASASTPLLVRDGHVEARRRRPRAAPGRCAGSSPAVDADRLVGVRKAERAERRRVHRGALRVRDRIADDREAAAALTSALLRSGRRSRPPRRPSPRCGRRARGRGWRLPGARRRPSARRGRRRAWRWRIRARAP